MKVDKSEMDMIKNTIGFEYREYNPSTQKKGDGIYTYNAKWFQQDCERYYREVVEPENVQKLRKFREEFGEIGVKMRLHWLNKLLMNEQVSLFIYYNRWYNKNEMDAPYREKKLLSLLIDSCLKKIKKLKLEIKFAENYGKPKSKNISHEDIVQARNYPITGLLSAKRDFTNCPFHDDKRPSFYVKNNFGYCFSCHTHADSIDIVMKKEGLDFVSAVQHLCQL